jgi:glutamate-1-semialdehyde 2,1-aminomutase
MVTIDRNRLKHLMDLEQNHFVDTHPRSLELTEKAKSNMPKGVPMNWMTKWASPHPIFMDKAQGSLLTDVDGNEYVDLCLGDTGAMAGHSPPPVIEVIRDQIGKGITFMCPTEDSIWVGKELSQRFGLPFWQIALSATDANRFAIRIARQITGRKKILAFNWCYHGSVDETLITLENGVAGPRQGNIGPAINPAETTRVIEFNDIDALKEALAPQDVACVLAEPALTNIGIVHPDPGFHDALRTITRDTGTILIIDETHTICCGPGGYTREHGLEPDMLTIGKPIASGVPAATYGFSQDIAGMIEKKCAIEDSDASGVGGTLSGNALSLSAMRATLENVLTAEAFENMIPLSKRFTDGVSSIIKGFKLPWNVTQLGARAEYWFRLEPARNGGEAAAAIDFELDRYMHLFAINNGILMTPFHNMALMSPSTTKDDVDHHTRVFRKSVQNLIGA